MLRQNFRLITIYIVQRKGQMGRLLIVFWSDVVVTQPLPRNGGMAEHHGALEAGKFLRAWTKGLKETENRHRASGAKSP